MQIQERVEEHLIIRSWFAVLLLCDENIFYVNLMHAQNMSHSKPKKSLVTIQRGHFMNSFDAFLEVSTHLFFPYLLK